MGRAEPLGYLISIQIFIDVQFPKPVLIPASETTIRLSLIGNMETPRLGLLQIDIIY